MTTTKTEKHYVVTITYGVKYHASFTTQEQAQRFLDTYQYEQESLERDFDDLPFDCYSRDLYWDDNLATLEEVEVTLEQDLDDH